MAVEFTKDQQKAINAQGTVLVAAAAGSGKTAVLTQRVIKRICNPNDPASIDRLLIVTFTNASALEMRIRIGKELDRVCAENPGNTELFKQKLLLKTAKICSIDAFCIDLVRTHFTELSISPDFKPVTQKDTKQYIDKALSSVLSKRFSEPDDDFKLLCDTIGVYNGDRGLNEIIYSVYEFCMCLSDSRNWLKKAIENYTVDCNGRCRYFDMVLETVNARLLSARDSLHFMLREAVGSEFEAEWQEKLGPVLDTINTMISYSENNEWDKLYNTAESYIGVRLESAKKGQDKQLHAQMKDVVGNVNSVVDSVLKDMCGDFESVKTDMSYGQRIVRCLAELVNEFADCYFDILNSNNLLTFSMVEQLALKLLCIGTDEGLAPSELSKDICKLYDEVLVDEYQDNNDLQDALFFAVSDSGKHLFMVGDVKQCIYAFRNANPDNFLKHKDSYPHYDGKKSPSKVILSANFRSRKGVCDFVNEICSSLMQKRTCGMDYTYDERLVAEAKYPENGLCATEVLLNNSSENTHACDAEAVACRITEIMNEKAFLRKKNDDADSEGDEGDLRKARYSDFTILLRYPGSSAHYYVDALKSHLIPVIYNSGEFYETDEILTVTSLLKVINNPTHDIPLLSCMSSVIFGFSFDEIAQIKAKYKAKSLYARLILASKDGNEKTLGMLDVIKHLQKSAVTLSPSDLIGEIYDLTHFKEIVSCADNGEEKVTNLCILKSMAADYESQSDGGLQGFVNYFDRCADEGQLGEKTPQTAVDAVRIMSFHGSKGLQFPICIIADIGKRLNKTDLNAPVITSGDYGIGVNYVSDSVKHDTVARRAIRDEQEFKLFSEELRLFYVAMTRAEERLIISLTSKNISGDICNSVASLGLFAEKSGKVPPQSVVTAESLKRPFLCAALLQNSGNKLREIAGLEPLPADGNAEFKTIFSPVAGDSLHRSNTVSDRVLTDFTPNSEVTEFLNKRLNEVYPYQDECLIPSKLAVTKLVHGDGNEFSFKSRPRYMSKAGLTPAERGTALHKFMQFSDFSKAECNIEDEITRLAEYEFISDEEANAIDRAKLSKFFSSGVYKRIKSADKVLREYKFMVKYPYNGSDTIIQGIADLIFIENGKAVILDFKTDDVGEMQTLADRYSEQLEIYKHAISEIFEIPSEECIIYSIKLGSSINV